MKKQELNAAADALEEAAKDFRAKSDVAAKLLYRAKELRAQAALLPEQGPVAQGWIPHTGEDCPVADGAWIDVKYRNGQIVEAIKASPKDGNWRDHFGSYKIAAYRAHLFVEAHPPQPGPVGRDAVLEEAAKVAEYCFSSDIDDQTADRIRALKSTPAPVGREGPHSQLVLDLAMLVRRLAYFVGKYAPAGMNCKGQAIEFLTKHGLQGSVLRDEYTEGSDPTP